MDSLRGMGRQVSLVAAKVISSPAKPCQIERPLVGSLPMYLVPKPSFPVDMSPDNRDWHFVPGKHLRRVAGPGTEMMEHPSPLVPVKKRASVTAISVVGPDARFCT